MADPPLANFYSEMEALRDACQAYNQEDGRSVPDIEIDEIHDDRIAMIIALWMRGVSVPTILLGDPYDKCFNVMISQSFYFHFYNYPKAKETILYRILTLALSDDERFNHLIRGSMAGFLIVLLSRKDKTPVLKRSLSVLNREHPGGYSHFKNNIDKIQTSLGIRFADTKVTIKDVIRYLPLLSSLPIVYILFSFLESNDIYGHNLPIHQYLNMIEQYLRKNEDKKETGLKKMALPPLGDLFSDIRSDQDIDEFYAKKELETLASLCREYNSKNPNTPIEIDEPFTSSETPFGEDKIGMIVALWIRDIPIPESITFGEPYDTSFRESIIKYSKEFRQIYGNSFPKTRKTFLYRIIHFLKDEFPFRRGTLIGFIFASLRNLEIHRGSNTVFTDKIKKIALKLNLVNISTLPLLIHQLPSLPSLAFVYIAVKYFNYKNPEDSIIRLHEYLDLYCV